jgi:hypothetical protein
MKNLILTLAMILSLFAALDAKAVDLNQLLRESHTSLEDLKKQNLQVLMGELTGAGKSIPAELLEGFVHPEGILTKKDFDKISLKTTLNAKVSDVIKVIQGNREFAANEFTGFIIRRSAR